LTRSGGLIFNRGGHRFGEALLGHLTKDGHNLLRIEIGVDANRLAPTHPNEYTTTGRENFGNTRLATDLVEIEL